MAGPGQDFRHAFRMLRKNPGFTAVVVLTLALGIGANTAIFSIVRAALTPIAMPDPDRVVIVHTDNAKRGAHSLPSSIPDFLDLKASGVFSNIAAFTDEGVNLRNGDRSERLNSLFVSGDFFQVTASKPHHGRLFDEADTNPGHDQVAILSHNAWQSRFNSDAGIIGRTIIIDGTPRAVIGVLPKVFPAFGHEEIYLPLVVLPPKSTSRGTRSYPLAGRLRAGLELDTAQKQVKGLSVRLAEQYPEDSGNTFRLQPIEESFVEDSETLLGVLFGAVGFVLLIACANIAGLLMARGSARNREMTIRAALGASRWKLSRQMLTESIVLALIGGTLAIVPAMWVIAFASSLNIDELPHAELISLNWGVLAFNLALSLFTGVLFGFVPALQVRKTNVSESLKAAGRSHSGASHHRMRSAFVVGEIALTLMLLAGAGLMLQSFLRLRSANPGYNSHGLLTMRVALSEHQYVDAAKQAAFFNRVVEKARELPGLDSISATTELPASDSIHGAGIQFPGRPEPRVEDIPIALYDSVTPGYFRTMQVPLRSGRFFSESDRAGSPLVVIVDEFTAQRFWPNQNPIGRQLKLGSKEPLREVVGVVGNVDQAIVLKLMLGQVGQVFLPFAQAPKPIMSLVVRTQGDQATATSAMRDVVRAIDVDQPLFQVRMMDEARAASRALQRLATSLLGAFALVAMLLAAIGIYGVVAFNVAQRTREFGIRMSLGAQQRDVLWSVVRHGILLTTAGLGIGLAGAFALTRVMSTLLYRIGANDPVTFAAVTVLLAFVSLVASYIPARRATKVDPVLALRHE